VTDWPSIVREHGPMAFETAWRILGDASDADDAVQEAFLDALRLHRAPSGRAIDNWGGLLRRIASCRALDLLRKRRKDRATRAAAPPDSGSTIATSSTPHAVVVAVEDLELLRHALADLPAREAEVFSLRYFGDLSNAEIATELNISAGAVAVAMHKARERLETALQFNSPDSGPRNAQHARSER
jgi:RNA polymerase sigma-70 factor (ECF subfamily)